MTGPHVYAEWLTLLDRFRVGDDSVLGVMQHGSIQWTNVVAERWTRQISDSLTTRLQTLSKQLQANLDRAGGDYFAISKALLVTRQGLSPLKAFVSLPAVPAELRKHLESELERWTIETQESLERHAHGVRHDQGRLLKTIRDHSLNTPMQAVVDKSAQGQEEPAPVPRRRVIL